MSSNKMKTSSLKQFLELSQQQICQLLSRVLQNTIQQSPIKYRKACFLKFMHKCEPKDYFEDPYNMRKNNKNIQNTLHFCEEPYMVLKKNNQLYISQLELQFFLEKIISFYHIENMTAIIALYYLKKMQNEKNITITQENVRLLMAFSLLIAQKQFCDGEITNSYCMGKIFPLINFTDVDILEIEFLKLIDFELYISERALENFCQWVQVEEENYNKEINTNKNNLSNLKSNSKEQKQLQNSPNNAQQKQNIDKNIIINQTSNQKPNKFNLQIGNKEKQQNSINNRDNKKDPEPSSMTSSFETNKFTDIDSSPPKPQVAKYSQSNESLGELLL